MPIEIPDPKNSVRAGFAELLAAIRHCAQHEMTTPATILAYSTIDIAGWLDADSPRASGKTFKAWITRTYSLRTQHSSAPPRTSGAHGAAWCTRCRRSPIRAARASSSSPIPCHRSGPAEPGASRTSRCREPNPSGQELDMDKWESRRKRAEKDRELYRGIFYEPPYSIAAGVYLPADRPGTRPKGGAALERPPLRAPCPHYAHISHRSDGGGGSDRRSGAHESCPHTPQCSPRLAMHCDHGCSRFSSLLQTSHMCTPLALHQHVLQSVGVAAAAACRERGLPFRQLGQDRRDCAARM
jgi:hypothetical protein